MDVAIVNYLPERIYELFNAGMKAHVPDSLNDLNKEKIGRMLDPFHSGSLCY